VLLPTDGSPGAETATEQALDVAERFDAALHVLFVVDTNALPLDGRSKVVFDQLNDDGRRSVESVVEHAEERGIDPVVREVLGGSPHEVILEYVEEHGIDLVVMGTHGRRGLSRYLLGSVTERVVRSSDAPVLVVRRTESTGA